MWTAWGPGYPQPRCRCFWGSWSCWNFSWTKACKTNFAHKNYQQKPQQVFLGPENQKLIYHQQLFNHSWSTVIHHHLSFTLNTWLSCPTVGQQLFSLHPVEYLRITTCVRMLPTKLNHLVWHRCHNSEPPVALAPPWGSEAPEARNPRKPGLSNARSRPRGGRSVGKRLAFCSTKTCGSGCRLGIFKVCW